ncbi:tetratricopeptide repeat protein [Mesorhizobium sp. M0959]
MAKVKKIKSHLDPRMVQCWVAKIKAFLIKRTAMQINDMIHEPMIRKWHRSFCRSLLRGLMVLFALSGPALAASSDCVGDDEADTARRIAACTLMIEDVTEPASSRLTAYFKRGVAWARQNDYDRAIADFDKAISLDPEDASAYYYRGITWALKSDADRAIADFDQAINLDPKSDAYRIRGSAWLDKGDNDRAIVDYD